ncbi:MAG: riboflavin kinase [Collinsella sp.]
MLNVGGAADAPADGPLPCVIAIGAFDGVHRGHADLLRHAIDDARERGVAAVAVTFDPDPDEVVSTHPAPKLTSMDGRLRALTSIGVRVAVVPFTRQLAALDHVAFSRACSPRISTFAPFTWEVTSGSAARGASTVPIIADWGAQKGIAVTGHDLILDGDAPITATRIRSLIARGDVDSARRLLGRRPMLRGQVGPGRGQGTGMGFPTANVEVPGYAQMPADGVYAGFAEVDGAVWPAAINAGVPPMFADSVKSARLEANLIGFSGDLYDKKVAIAFDRLLRPSHSFESVDALIEAVNRDIETVREQFGTSPVRIARDF